MIGYFPDPYPDELFYSLCARYSQRMQYPGQSTVSQELFGSRSASPNVDLPGHLGVFAAALPPGHSCRDLAQLIDRHTLWPFYCPFLPVKRQQAILAAMLGTAGHRPDLLAGLAGTDIPRPEWQRFCPCCAEEDRARFGECYWRRLHQGAGVYLCPTHTVLLESSSVGLGWRSSARFIAAEGVIQPIPGRTLPPTHPWYEPLLRLAREVAWLLDQPALAVGQANLQQRYRLVLAERGWASYTGVIKTGRLIQALVDSYPADLLAWLHCQLDGTIISHWLGRLTRSERDFLHPLRHLLLMHCLGHTVQTILQLPVEPQPFGSGPWPCLNPVCPHYRQPVIQAYQLESRHHRRPVATFTCECGFQYRREGPDRSAEDRFRVGRRVAYGPLWEAELGRLWLDPTLNLTQMAGHLGVNEPTLNRQAARLGLPFPAPGSRVVAHSRRTPPAVLRLDPCPPPAPADEYRARWRTVRADHPELGRHQLQRQFRRLADWLRRHDRDWFTAHLPPPQQVGRLPKPKTPRLNWSERDTQLAQAVKLAAQQLRDRPGRPLRITMTAIAGQVKLLYSSRYSLDKLPLTVTALAEVVETWEATMVRRVEWAAAGYRQESLCPTRRQLCLRAGVNSISQKLLSVQAALDTALVRLHQGICFA